MYENNPFRDTMSLEYNDVSYKSLILFISLLKLLIYYL